MTESPSAAATAVLYNGRAAEMLIAFADESTGALHTLRFEESRTDLGEVELVLCFDWPCAAPPGAAIILPEGGLPLEKLDDYWAMWGNGEKLFGQSARQEDPLSSALAPEEWIIDRPIVAANQQLHVYGWRGGTLVRHRFGAQATLETIMETEAQPSLSICAPLPGDTDGTAFLGFVDETADGISATVLYTRDRKVMRLQGCPEGRYRLMKRHRMGVHVGGKTRPALAVMTIDSEDDSYALLEARFDFAKKECIWKRTRLETIAPATLRSAAVFYYKTVDAPEPFILAINTAGELISPRRRNVRTLRSSVPPGYSFPILTTVANRYEAVGAGRDIALKKL